MKKNSTAYVVSTVILTIITIISLILIILIIPFSIQGAVDSVQPSEDASGGEQIIASGATGIAVSLLIIIYYFLAGFEVIISIIGMIIGFINRKTENKKLRNYNYVLLGLMTFTCIASIVKIILWRCRF